MNPQAVIPGQAIQPAANTTTPQGVAQPTAVGAPVPTQLPSAPPVAATPAPVATPNFDTAGAISAIGDYYNIPRQTAAITGAGQAQGQVAQQQFEQQKAMNSIQISKLQDQLNPQTYKITQSDDAKSNTPGAGLTITNALGQSVSLAQYVNLTGEDPTSVLSKSNNPNDQAFVAASQNLQNYIQTKIAAQNGSQLAQAQLNDYYEQNPGLQNLELGQLSQAFMNKYGSYYGQPSTSGAQLPQGVNPTIQSANNPVTQSGYENPNLQAQFQANPFQTAGNSLTNQLSALQSQVNGG